MTDYRKAYGLPERYFLSLGRMVEKKNLATLVAAYAKFCDESRGLERQPLGNRVTCDESARQAPASLVFVGSGELESPLREQARSLGLRVVDRTDWRVEKTGHGLTRINTAESERLAADRTEGNADGRMIAYGPSTAAPPVAAADEGPQSQAEPRLCETGLSQNFKLNTEHSVENDRGAVYFYGFRQIEENAVFYALAEAFVLPSLKEEWGLVVNEAMACSLPVIVSRTAGCAEDLLPGSEQVAGTGVCGDGSPRRPTGWRVAGKETTDGEDVAATKEADARAARPYLEQRSSGFIFDPTSVEALAEALRRLADDGELRQAMGCRSREIVEQFSCDNFARQALRAAQAAAAESQEA